MDKLETQEGQGWLFKNRLLFGSLAVSMAFVFILYTLLDPQWETNDDIAMSMIAHGYGLAAFGSPNLVFSNVIWGYIVRGIPEINGVLGYSTVTVAVLVVIGAVLTYSLMILKYGYIVAFSVLALILVRPVIFPQFTINAGLLMVAAIICWRLFELKLSKKLLILGCVFALCSFLVRSLEFFLVFAISLPLLPWETLRSERVFKIALVGLIVVIASSAYINYEAYQGAEWDAFNELNPIRASFTDFGMGSYLKARPDILERHSYSYNDIDLIGNWFFVDSNIVNPTNLGMMLKELGSIPEPSKSLANGWVGIKTLLHPNLLPALVVAFLLALLRPSWRIAVTWGLFIAAVFILGLLGRPGILRVYSPVVALLLIAPLLQQRALYSISDNRRRALIMAVVFVAALINISTVVAASKADQVSVEQTRRALRGFPVLPVVIWGGSFPFSAAYPVLTQSPLALSYRLYGLGVLTLAPFSVSVEEENSGYGMVDRLFNNEGVPIMANNPRFELLSRFCKERFDGELTELAVQNYTQWQISWRKCNTNL